jgi:hypothetical protein
MTIVELILATPPVLAVVRTRCARSGARGDRTGFCLHAAIRFCAGQFAWDRRRLRRRKAISSHCHEKAGFTRAVTDARGYLDYLCHQSSLPHCADGRFAAVILGSQLPAVGRQLPNPSRRTGRSCQPARTGKSAPVQAFAG